MNKFKAYLGLCMKSGNLVIGQDNIKVSKHIPFAIILGYDASENLKDLAIRMSEKYKCCCIMINDQLDSILPIKNCKIVGTLNKGLTDAMLKFESEYKYLRRNNG